jgi:hypothetical protein
MPLLFAGGNTAGMTPAKGLTMRTEAAIDRVKRDLHRALDTMHADLNRVEILAAALSAFSRPIPDYEPGFRHLHHLTLTAHEIG